MFKTSSHFITPIHREEVAMRNSHTSLFDKRFIMAILLLFVFGCGQKTENEQKSQGGTLKPAGTIRVSGAWALYPMMVKWGEEYSKINPDMRIDISAGGAGKGIADALGGLVDIGMVSREIKPEEVKQGAFYVPVVKDAVFPTLNENNKAVDVIGKQGIKKKIFMDLWTNSKNVSWGVIAGTNSTDKIQVYTRSDSCGAAETWALYLEGKKQADLKGIGVYGDP
ncbi:MAG: PstS family phosphate ABC transporter substrate-binding protein, partial [Desulfobacteraceae bacterium]